ARRRHLLEDLELVLAQIVQLPAEASADRALVQRSIEPGAALSRPRSTIPAGCTSGTYRDREMTAIRILTRSLAAVLLAAAPAVAGAQQAAAPPRSHLVIVDGDDLTGLAALGSLRSLTALGRLEGLRHVGSLAQASAASAELQLDASRMAMGL